MIMVGHITLPNVTEEIPATLSHDIVTGILREEMKYNGIIITDSMAMSAIANLYSSDEAAVKAIQVGMRYDFNAISAGKCHKWHRNSSEFWRHNGKKNRKKVMLRILKVKLEAGIIEN